MTSEEKSMEFYLKTDVDKIDVDKDVMRQSLSFITQEIQRFHFYNDTYPQNDIFEIIKKYKSSLKSKNKQMKKLSENIKIACIVAKTIISAKEKESTSMKDLVESLRNESDIIFKKNLTLQTVVEELTKENTIVYNKIDGLHNLINLGYGKIQNIRKEPMEDLTVFTKLKKIILCCGQYYADFYTEHQRCEQLQQKIRFYQNKAKILENNLKKVTDEVKNLQYQNMKLQNQINYDRQKDFISTIPIAYSDSQIHKELNKSTFQQHLQIIQKSRREKPKIDLSTHLLLVKNLLSDQDSIIQNLNQLSKELSNCN